MQEQERVEEANQLLSGDELDKVNGIELDTFSKGRWWRRNRNRLGWTWMTSWVWGAFTGFVWLARFAPQILNKYLASATLPAEVFNATLVTYKKLVGREKPWWILVSVVLPLMLVIGTVLVVDLQKFGVIAASGSFLAGWAAAGPIAFTAVFSVFTVLNAVRAIQAIRDYRIAKDTNTLTPMHTIRVVTRVAKTLAFALFASFIIPFMFSLGGLIVMNPIGIIAFAGVLTVAVGILIGVKIYKTVTENREWKKTIAEELSKINPFDAKCIELDPYKVLGVDREHLNSLIDAYGKLSRAEKLVNMFAEIKHGLQMFWAKRVSKDQLRIDALEDAAKERNAEKPSRYIEAQFQAKLAGISLESQAQRESLSRIFELVKKERGRETYKEHVWEKELKELRGQGSAVLYATFKTNRVTLEKTIAAKEKAAGFFKRVSGEARREAIEEHFAGKGMGVPHRRELIKLLSEKNGQKLLDKYDAERDKTRAKLVRKQSEVAEDGLMPDASGSVWKKARSDKGAFPYSRSDLREPLLPSVSGQADLVAYVPPVL